MKLEKSLEIFILLLLEVVAMFTAVRSDFFNASHPGVFM